MKEKLSVLKRAWVVLVTVAIIGLGAGLLYGAIGKSQSDKLSASRTVANQAETLSAQPIIVTPTSAPAVAAREASPSDTVLDKLNEPKKLSYTVVDVLKEDGASPTAADISLQKVGEITFEAIKGVFDYTLDGENVYVEYLTFEGVMDTMFRVYVSSADTPDHEKAKYSLCMDSRTGALQNVELVIPDTEHEHYQNPEKAETALARVDHKLMGDAIRDAECFKLVRGVVERFLLHDREILEIQCNAVQWAFITREGCKICADFDVHMSEGECYRVRLAYPGKYVISVSFFPLGWDSCLWGIYDEDELKAYLDELEAQGFTQSAPLASEPAPIHTAPVALSTPTPTPLP